MVDKETCKKRWENAKRIARLINSYIDEGKFVFGEDGGRIFHKFIITDDEINLPFSNGSYVTYFIYDDELDNGCYDTIEEYNNLFSGWTVVNPKDIQPILL